MVEILAYQFFYENFVLTEQYEWQRVKYIYMAFAADPTTIEPSLEDSFNTVTYTWNKWYAAITTVGFQPDLLGLKIETGALCVNFTDSIRGVGNYLNN
jgi:hypothetical protein